MMIMHMQATERKAVWVYCSAQGYGSHKKAASLGEIRRLQTCDMEAQHKQIKLYCLKIIDTLVGAFLKALNWRRKPTYLNGDLWL